MNKQGRPDPEFNGFRRASSDFKRVQSQFSTEILSYELDLTSARSFAAGVNTFADLPFAGNSFYVDQNSDVGNATVMFANQQTPGTVVPIFAQPGFIARAPFTRLMVANSAQVGKKLRFFYGVDIDFVPAINGTLSIGSIGGTVNTNNVGMAYAVAFASTTAMGALTPTNIIAAAANTNGYTLWDAELRHANTTPTDSFATFLAKATAPVNTIDGDVLLVTQPNYTAVNQFSAFAKLINFQRVAAGKRLDAIGIIAEAGNVIRKALYTLS